MSGLFRKALSIRERALNPPSEVSSDLQDREISAEDRAAISERINELIARSRLEVGPETFRYRSKRSGALIPVVINLAAVVLIVVSTLLLVLFFNLREESITQTADIKTAEAQLLRALKEQSDQKLREKDSQIADMRSRLDELRREKQLLELRAEAELREREQEFNSSLESELAAEEARLQEEGASAERIEELLARMEEARRAEFEAELETIRSQLQAELAEREAAIARYEQELREALLEKSQLQQQWNAQRSELETQLEESERALAEQRNRVLEEVRAIREDQRRQRLVLEQIIDYYRRVQGHMAEGSWDRAAQELGRLEGYLTEQPAEQSDRREVELLLVRSLRALIEEARTPRASEQRSAMPSRTLERQELVKTIAEGDAAYLRGDDRVAVESYERAIGLMGSGVEGIDTVVERLLDIGARTSVDEEQIAAVREARALIQRAATLESRRRALLDRLGRLQTGYASTSAEAETAAERERERLVSLLEAKLLVKEILDSPAVRSDHPRLYDRIEEYFRALGAEQRGLGYDQGLTDVVEIIDAIQGETGIDDVQAIWSRRRIFADDDPLAGIFTRLRELIQTAGENVSTPAGMPQSRRER